MDLPRDWPRPNGNTETAKCGVRAFPSRHPTQFHVRPSRPDISRRVINFRSISPRLPKHHWPPARGPLTSENSAAWFTPTPPFTTAPSPPPPFNPLPFSSAVLHTSASSDTYLSLTPPHPPPPPSLYLGLLSLSFCSSSIVIYFLFFMFTSRREQIEGFNHGRSGRTLYSVESAGNLLIMISRNWNEGNIKWALNTTRARVQMLKDFKK